MNGTQGSVLLYILLLTVIPVASALLIALPFIADSSRPGRSDRQQASGVPQEQAAAGAFPSPSSERKSPGRADRAA